MCNCVQWTFLLLCGVLLLAPAGCQTETRQSAPGALPVGLKSDVTPRLNASTYFAHGHLLERQGDYEHAVQQYRQALALKPDFLSARNRLGITLNKLGRHAEATREFRQAITQDPTQAYLHNNLGFSLYLENRYQEAADVLRHALALRPDYTRARMNYGVVLARLGKYEPALAEFTIATGQADAYYNLGVIQTDLGDYAAAARSLELALSLDPGFDVARQQLHEVARLAAAVRPPTGPAADSGTPALAQSRRGTEDLDPDGDAVAADVELAANVIPMDKPQPRVEPAAADVAARRMTVAEVQAAIRAALVEAGRIPAHTPAELIPPELTAQTPDKPAQGRLTSMSANIFAGFHELGGQLAELFRTLGEGMRSMEPPPAPESTAPPTAEQVP